MVPSLIKKLDETNVALHQSPRQQAVIREGCLAGLGAIHLVDGLRLIGDIHQLGNAGLHPVGHFILTDSCSDFGISHVSEGLLVEIVHCIHNHLAFPRGNSLRIGQVEDRVALGSKFDPLMDGWKKSASECAIACPEDLPCDQDHKSREILVFASQTIAYPRAHAGPPESFEPRQKKHLRGRMVELICVQGLDEA